MTERELKRIGTNNHKLLILKNKYDDMRYKSLAKGQIITDMPRASTVKDNIADYTTDLIVLQEEIEVLQHTTNLLIARARAFIDVIPDCIIQMILELKYINNIPEYSIPYLIGNNLKEKDIKKIVSTFFLDRLLYM